jgi:hypothetical protein
MNSKASWKNKPKEKNFNKKKQTKGNIFPYIVCKFVSKPISVGIVPFNFGVTKKPLLVYLFVCFVVTNFKKKKKKKNYNNFSCVNFEI